MIGGINTRILGSSLVGLGLVAGAWWLNATSGTAVASNGLVNDEAPVRNTLSVSDRNKDGIEDWQEPFLTASPVILDKSSIERSNTLTERMSIALMEGYMISRASGPAAESSASIVKGVMDRASYEVQDKIYGREDIQIAAETDPESIRIYANQVALIILTNDLSGLRNEVILFNEALETGNPALYAQMAQIAAMYEKNRDEFLTVSVPENLVIQHLNLINVFNALARDITGFAVADKDPVLGLLRLKRYQEDATALGLAILDMNKKLSGYPGLFQNEDPALFFATFNKVGT